MNGHIFQDFIVHENTALLAHGRFVSVIDLDNPVQIKPVHL